MTKLSRAVQNRKLCVENIQIFAVNFSFQGMPNARKLIELLAFEGSVGLNHATFTCVSLLNNIYSARGLRNMSTWGKKNTYLQIKVFLKCCTNISLLYVMHNLLRPQCFLVWTPWKHRRKQCFRRSHVYKFGQAQPVGSVCLLSHFATIFTIAMTPSHFCSSFDRLRSELVR